MTRKLIAALAAVTALTIAAPAFADETFQRSDDHVQTSVRISTAGYNLDTPRGAQRFYAVLDHAAKRVCDTGDRSLQSRRIERACVAETMNRTVSEIGSPYLSAALGSKTGARMLVASR